MKYLGANYGISLCIMSAYIYVVFFRLFGKKRGVFRGLWFVLIRLVRLLGEKCVSFVIKELFFVMY